VPARCPVKPYPYREKELAYANPAAGIKLAFNTTAPATSSVFTGGTGTLLTNYKYAPWGQAQATVAGVKNRYQFASEAIRFGYGLHLHERALLPARVGPFLQPGRLGGQSEPVSVSGVEPGAVALHV
jgi:hypothetical protein